ncbi:MAG: LapA family protein [Gracilimonas sp.]|uniref:LapA family protein n=1 Tax=Gracilimonas TaxID=649462 RepID=UPI001B2E2954|nr:LapA family protein [Gracilimonas sp.]MBO6587104.1 LapA family protein [Gracilimonas sp.]MBO6614408.1 LapA family protein [Gracilimonas sp.]
MKKLKLSLVAVLCLILILIIIQNTVSVEAHFLWFSTDMSLVVLLFLTGVIGLVSGLILGFLIKGKEPQKPSTDAE